MARPSVPFGGSKAWLIRLWRFLGTWAIVGCGLVLMLAAAVHRLQLDVAAPQPYTSSPLIAIEMVMILVMCLLFVLYVVRACYLLWHKRWQQLALLAISTVAALVCLIAALQIDAPTLLYMT